jgi:hypothetical protein
MTNDNFFEEIPEGDVRKSGKGRKPNPQTKMIADRLVSVKAGKALVIRGLAIDLNGKNADDVKRETARVGALIRSAARLAGVRVSLTWYVGIPTVKILGKIED